MAPRVPRAAPAAWRACPAVDNFPPDGYNTRLAERDCAPVRAARRPAPPPTRGSAKNEKRRASAVKTDPPIIVPEASSQSHCAAFWTHCLSCLEQELPAQQFKTWILPLRVEDLHDGDAAGLRLVAPSNFHRQWLRDRYLRRIEELGEAYFGGVPAIEVGLAPAGGVRRPAVPATHAAVPAPAAASPAAAPQPAPRASLPEAPQSAEAASYDKSRLNPDFTFDTLVTGRANDLARAAALQVAQNPGVSYNPLFIYGGVGLGKTHLIHALGNYVFKHDPKKVIRYVHAEDYYADVVRAYQQKSFDVFKRYYRSLDVLIIDDIQFFNNKNRTQEEFFHAFNALTEAKKQIIITSDTYPKDVQGLEDRLISRFDWGLTVQIEPPELEMRVAILKKKAEVERIQLDDDVAFLIAKNLRSNVRELEGALKKVLAFARFHGKEVTLEVAKEALKDLLNAHNRQLTAEFIQKTVADYYKIKVADMHSKKRTRVIARPRQVAMFLAKDLTPMSLPAIGEAFGGRDHTTVLHACRTIAELRLGDTQLNHDLHVLTQVLRG